MYKVQFHVHRSGYKQLQLEGIYVPKEKEKMSVPEMKRDVTAFIKRELANRNKAFENFQVELTVFKKLKTDFLYHPKTEVEPERGKEEPDGN